MHYQIRLRLLLCFLVPISLTGRQSHPAFNWNTPRFRELGPAQTLARAHNISFSTRTFLISAIEGRLRPSMTELGISGESELRKIAEQSRVQLEDLNGDGTAEAIVQAIGLKSGCGATGNCPFWVFTKASNEYRPIMDVGGVQMYRFETSRTHGYRDLAIASHDSATEKHVYVYHYSRGKYQPFRCYDLLWADIPSGTLRILSQPTVTPCKIAGGE